MDNQDVLDLRHERKKVTKSEELSSYSSEIAHPLDLRISKHNALEKSAIFSFDGCVEYIRPSVITPNMQFIPNTLNQRSRWNHRSHPSIDSDSSFESEQENDFTHSLMWFPRKRIDSVETTRCSSTESCGKRDSLSSSELPDPENESDGTNSPLSMGFYKELPALTANVSIGHEERHGKILELSSCQAEIIDPEDVQSELKGSNLDINRNDEDNDEINENSLQICETETYIEELLKMQANDGNNAGRITKSITVGIQETANKFITEIRKTKADMYTSGLNLEVDGKKKQHCQKCDEEFYSLGALLQHQMTHTSRNPGEKLIKCPVCTKRFSTLTTLEHHIQRLHTGDMKYVCQVCEAPYKFSTHLRKHILTSRCGKGAGKKSAYVSP